MKVTDDKKQMKEKKKKETIFSEHKIIKIVGFYDFQIIKVLGLGFFLKYV